jgi:hypothetical protein
LSFRGHMICLFYYSANQKVSFIHFDMEFSYARAVCCMPQAAANELPEKITRMQGFGVRFRLNCQKIKKWRETNTEAIKCYPVRIFNTKLQR